MFPSGDPFAYPNQPMTHLEGNNLGAEQAQHSPMRASFNPQQQTATNPSQHRHSFDPALDEVQLYALPPYFIQGQQALPGFDSNFQGDVMGVGGQTNLMGLWPSEEGQSDWLEGQNENKSWSFTDFGA